MASAGSGAAPKPSAGESAAGTSTAAAERPFGSQVTDWDPKNPPPGYVYAKGVKGWEGINPVKALTDTELGEVAKTGKMPAHAQAELEHARIPQRVGKELIRVGVPPEEAAAVTKQTDPENLEPVNRESHAWMDEEARPGRNKTLPKALDDRDVHPFSSATDDEIARIIDVLKQKGGKFNSPEGDVLRKWLSLEKKRRPRSSWEAP